MVTSRKTRRLLVMVVASGLALVADDLSNRPLSATHTENFNVPTAGSIRLENSFGEVDIDGWDRPDVEVTVIKSAEEFSGKKGRTGAQQRLDNVQISVRQNEHDTIIATVYRERPGFLHLFGRRGDVDINYRIHAPRDSKLIIDHNSGGLNIAGMSGDIHGTVANGQITLTLSGGQYAIDAKCKIGKVYSDFEGHDHRRHVFGDEFGRPAATPAPNLYLRAGFGDIVILKTQGLPRAE